MPTMNNPIPSAPSTPVMPTGADVGINVDAVRLNQIEDNAAKQGAPIKGASILEGAQKGATDVAETQATLALRAKAMDFQKTLTAGLPAMKQAWQELGSPSEIPPDLYGQDQEHQVMWWKLAKEKHDEMTGAKILGLNLPYDQTLKYYQMHGIPVPADLTKSTVRPSLDLPNPEGSPGPDGSPPDDVPAKDAGGPLAPVSASSPTTNAPTGKGKPVVTGGADNVAPLDPSLAPIDGPPVPKAKSATPSREDIMNAAVASGEITPDQYGKVTKPVKTMEPRLLQATIDLKAKQGLALDALTKLRNRTPGGKGVTAKLPNQAALESVLHDDYDTMTDLGTEIADLKESAPDANDQIAYPKWESRLNGVQRRLDKVTARVAKNALLASSTDVIDRAKGVKDGADDAPPAAPKSGELSATSTDDQIKDYMRHNQVLESDITPAAVATVRKRLKKQTKAK